MREYKFRGRKIETNWIKKYTEYEETLGEFVYGSLLDLGGNDTYIGVTNNYEESRVYGEPHKEAIYIKVSRETVGQYTGKKDEENKEIFDGDHLYAPGNLDDDLQYVGTVEWDDNDNRWEVSSFHGRFEYIPDGCVVRGSLHDNLDLLEENEFEHPHLLNLPGEVDHE
ncbi:YopX family protein [Neobacillus mesonae]|nr:YopX family protein [Neobacillus mesonae]